jgi:hypothetical protein
MLSMSKYKVRTVSIIAITSRFRHESVTFLFSFSIGYSNRVEAVHLSYLDFKYYRFSYTQTPKKFREEKKKKKHGLS